MKPLNSVGYVNLRASLIGLKLKLMILFTTLIFVSGCSEFALIASAGGVAASQNTYAKVYNGVDFMTYMSTQRTIKKHIHDKAIVHIQKP